MNRIDRLLEIISKPSRKVIGLMSGTSVDAIDSALVEIEGFAETAVVRQLAFESFPFPPSVRRRIFDLFDPERSRVDELCNLDFILGELFAEAAKTVMARNGFTPAEIDLISAAGQTVWHDPNVLHPDLGVDWIDHPIRTRSTLAIGQSAVIAERTGVITVGDLRVRDVAAGGHGAPLTAYADWVLLRHPEKGRCIQNIGGIGNVTWLAPAATLDQVIAFDTGPGNMIIDALTEITTSGRASFDRDGALALSGTVHEDLLRGWMEDPYFRETPPKTTGREHFGKQFAVEILDRHPEMRRADLIATATALTAESIARSYRDFVLPRGRVDEVILGGGGALNPALRAMLQQRLPGVALMRHEDVGIDSRAKESIAMAIIANDSVMGATTNVPGATGGRPAVLGKLSL